VCPSCSGLNLAGGPRRCSQGACMQPCLPVSALTPICSLWLPMCVLNSWLRCVDARLRSTALPACLPDLPRSTALPACLPHLRPVRFPAAHTYIATPPTVLSPPTKLRMAISPPSPSSPKHSNGVAYLTPHTPPPPPLQGKPLALAQIARHAMHT